MYWIYLIVFSVIVFIPSIIQNGRFGLSLVQTQEYVILLIGIVTFVAFSFREKRYKKNLQEKSKMATQVNRMSKELTSSYSYIGEINRKLDILENITVGFPETSELPNTRRVEVYDSIMSAVQMFTKSDDFVLRFVDEKNCDVLKEIKSRGNKNVLYDQNECEPGGNFFENEEIIFVRSLKTIDNVYACILIKKKNSSQQANDPELLKTLAMQALFLFMFIYEKNSQKNNIENNN